MTVGIVGLGLIGGSFAKAISENTAHTVLGYDISEQVVEVALKDGAISGKLQKNNLSECDILLLSLYPLATVDFILENAKYIKKGGLVVDSCGTKRYVCAELFPIAKEHGFHFIGGHPMAGIELSGYENSFAKLFCGASMILCPNDLPDTVHINTLKTLFDKIGFGQVTISDPDTHDRIIAYTSQLAHIVSSAYVNSDCADRHRGFSAGSFRDMTRVATLNEPMWAELMLENSDNLEHELDSFISRLENFRQSLQKKDKNLLLSLLHAGKEKKRKISK